MAAKLSADVAHASFDLQPTHQIKAKENTANHCETLTCQAWIGDYLSLKVLYFAASPLLH